MPYIYYIVVIVIIWFLITLKLMYKILCHQLCPKAQQRLQSAKKTIICDFVSAACYLGTTCRLCLHLLLIFNMTSYLFHFFWKSFRIIKNFVKNRCCFVELIGYSNQFYFNFTLYSCKVHFNTIFFYTID